MDAQLSSLCVYEDFLPTIEVLKQLWYQTAVVSNLSKPYSYPLIHLVPKNTFTYKLLSYEIGMQKPDKQIFDHLKKISWYESDEIVMVGDSFSSDVQWAKNVGIDSVHIDRSSLWIIYHDGYVSISSLKQLLEIL
jgi:HAD superfamily hydrolase (TIGR01549 family)